MDPSGRLQTMKKLLAVVALLALGASMASAQEKPKFAVSASSKTLGYSPLGWRTVIQIMGDRGLLKAPLPSPAKYLDHSYVEEALKELGRR